MANCETVTNLEVRPNIKIVVLNKPVSGEEKYQKFPNELQSYGCGYWKWLRKRRIREVFVVDNIKNPTNGKIDKIRIKRKVGDFIELADSRRFDVKTGRSVCEEPKYIFPVADRLVWNGWEPQSLRRRVERVLPALSLADVRSYADTLSPGWMLGIYSEKLDAFCGRNFARPAAMLSEREEAGMASCRNFAKKTILENLPGAIHELKALVDMMEEDAK